MRLNAWFGLIVALVLATAIRANGAPSRRQSTPEAYVTLLYGDEFLLGVRVLGKSIRDTGSTKDMVVLVSDGVSGYAMKLLKVIIAFFFLCFYIALVEMETNLIMGSESVQA